MLAQSATMIDTGKIMENAEQLTETFFGTYVSTIDISGIYHSG